MSATDCRRSMTQLPRAILENPLHWYATSAFWSKAAFAEANISVWRLASEQQQTAHAVRMAYQRGRMP